MTFVCLAGVLFSIEVTSTYYPVRNYMFAYVACVIASISFLVARQRPAFLLTQFAISRQGQERLDLARHPVLLTHNIPATN